MGRPQISPKKEYFRWHLDRDIQRPASLCVCAGKILKNQVSKRSILQAKTPLGISQKILVDEWWEFELGLVVGLTAFSLYITYLLPLNYLDLLHRAAVHLGTWVSSDYTKPQQTGFAK